MSAMDQTSPSLFGFLDLPTIIALIAVAVAAITAERLIARYLSRVAKRLRMDPHTTNNLVLTFRILILFFAVAAMASIGRLQPEWILSLSAIGGAALGFASTKTIGNFIAGLFLLAARPFKVGDYVRLGTVEGIVQEININYTKVLTIGKNTISVSNLQILDRDITNFCEDELHCYTFEIAFSHEVSTSKTAEIFIRVFEKHLSELPRPPAYMLARSSGIERVYMVYLYVDKPEDIFTYRPLIAEELFDLWDQARTTR
ncbi:MAG: mechanosensitive ion channel family protein [Candidatus Bathyarchaeia archaeon]